jgi:hypothetical protein
MAVTNELFLFGLGILNYLVLAISWNFNLFKHDESNNVMKAALVWLLLFFQPLITQLAILYATDLSRSADILTLLKVTYRANVIILIFASVYFIVMFVYNALLYFARNERK